MSIIDKINFLSVPGPKISLNDPEIKLCKFDTVRFTKALPWNWVSLNAKLQQQSWRKPKNW